jgi:hypothetical protein
MRVSLQPVPTRVATIARGSVVARQGKGTAAAGIGRAGNHNLAIGLKGHGASLVKTAIPEVREHCAITAEAGVEVA